MNDVSFYAFSDELQHIAMEKGAGVFRRAGDYLQRAVPKAARKTQQSAGDVFQAATTGPLIGTPRGYRIKNAPKRSPLGVVRDTTKWWRKNVPPPKKAYPEWAA